MVNLKKYLKSKEIALVVILSEKRQEEIMEITKFVSKFKKPCFISLNRPYSSLIEEFDANKIDYKHFLIIDGMTKKAAHKTKKIKNVIYLSSPHSLSELSIYISQALKRKVDIVMFDSLSTLLIYEKPDTILKFVHNVVGKIRISGCTTIFTVLKADAESKLIKDLTMLVDKSVVYEK